MRDYALVFLVTAAVTYLLTPLVRRIAVRTHAMHEPRARDTHVQATPLLGGLAMYGGLVAGLLIASRLSFVQAPFQTGTRSQAGLLLAGGLVVLVGFADDRWGLSAISRLAAQVAAAGILVWSGQSLPWLPTPNGGVFSLEPDLSVTLTILLVVVTMNAINFIDGLDGLASGIVAVAALSFLVYSYSLIKTIGSTSQSLPAVTSALLAGMCIGFLPHNFYPARIFMGDIGAMLLGLLLAYGPISSAGSLDPALLIAYSQNHPLDRFPTILPLLVPAAIFIIPYADLMFAVARRAKAGKPLMAADRQHLHHRLLNIGHSYRQSVLLMYLWAALFSVTVVSLSLVRTPSVVFVGATLVAVLALLPATMPRLRPWGARIPAKPLSARKPAAPVPPAHGTPAPVPPAQVPSAHVPATATPVPDVPRFLPAEPSSGITGANGTTSPFTGQPVSTGRNAAPWEQASSNVQDPWPGEHSFPGQDPFPAQHLFSGHSSFPAQDPIPDRDPFPDPGDEALEHRPHNG
jgi:UDP-GlcNAc:undecaprenyl-phosphate/decaprenyl-phosphate GlcNAc-1-phosphate transferase